MACTDTATNRAMGLGVTDGFERLELSAAQDDSATQIFDLKNRLNQTLRDWNVKGVAVLNTTKYGNWTYAAASKRLHAESAVMIAAVETGAEFCLAKQSQVTKFLHTAAISDLTPESIGLPPGTKYWTTGGAEAYAASLYWGSILASQD
jgi:hypothetical protein